MNDHDYRDILQFTRDRVTSVGLSAIDERIMSNMRGSEGALWDLTFYLKHLREEIQLGSDAEYRETLRRVRRYVETESGRRVEGIRIELSPEDAERYGMRHFEITPNAELGEIATELGLLIESLIAEQDDDIEPEGRPR
jgi:hypothetical protein